MTREEYIVEIAEKIEGMKEKNIYIFGITKATVFLANYLVGRGVKYIGLLDNNQQKVNEYNEMFSMLINYEKIFNIITVMNLKYQLLVLNK